MVVVIKGVAVELPEAEAQRLIQLGYAHPLEVATVEPGGKFSSTRTPRGQKQATGSKPRNSQNASSKQATKQRSTQTMGLKAQTPSGTESKSTRKG
jgi:hypothetical protein